MIFNDSLLVFEDELLKRSVWRIILDILRKYTFDARPIHTHRGRVSLIGDVLSIDMKHVKSSAPLHMDIPLKDIVGLDFGFDNVYASFMSPIWSGPCMKPLYIAYVDKSSAKVKFYLFADLDPGLHVYPNSRTQDLYEVLGNRVAELLKSKD